MNPDAGRVFLWPAGLLFAACVAAVAVPHFSNNYFEPYFGAVLPVLAVTLVGLPGLAALRWLCTRHGFSILPTHRVGWTAHAAVIAVFATVAIVSDIIWRFPESINAPWPWSLAFYGAIAVFVEFLFHVIPVALVLGFITMVRPERSINFPILAALISLAEPIVQVSDMVLGGPASALGVITAINVFAINLFQLLVFRWHGFLAMLTVRLVYYLIWHIAWGILRLDLLF